VRVLLTTQLLCLNVVAEALSQLSGEVLQGITDTHNKHKPWLLLLLLGACVFVMLLLLLVVVAGASIPCCAVCVVRMRSHCPVCTVCCTAFGAA
jgi:hypothetical protein